MATLYGNTNGIRPDTKLSKITRAMQEGREQEALRIAGKFYELGDERQAIERGAQALSNPEFFRGLGLDPDALIAAGVDAIRRRYSIPHLA